MKLLSIGKRICTIPERWEELTGPQLIKVMQLLFSGNVSGMTRVALLRILLDVSKYKMWRIGGEKIQEYLYLTDFLLGDNTLTKNLLPKYGVFVGPGDDFCNLVAAEYTYAEYYFSEYHNAIERGEFGTGDLNMLLATLYRPAKKKYDHALNPDGDSREPYNDNVTATYARQVAYWPLPVKQAILFWYEGCRINLRKKHPTPFEGGGEPAKYGMYTVMRGIAEKGIHGAMKDVERMYVGTLMMEITEIIEEARKLPKPKPQ